jgi:hypothetical protein
MSGEAKVGVKVALAVVETNRPFLVVVEKNRPFLVVIEAN